MVLHYIQVASSILNQLIESQRFLPLMVAVPYVLAAGLLSSYVCVPLLVGVKVEGLVSGFLVKFSAEASV